MIETEAHGGRRRERDRHQERHGSAIGEPAATDHFCSGRQEEVEGPAAGGDVPRDSSYGVSRERGGSGAERTECRRRPRGQGGALLARAELRHERAGRRHGAGDGRGLREHAGAEAAREQEGPESASGLARRDRQAGADGSASGGAHGRSQVGEGEGRGARASAVPALRPAWPWPLRPQRRDRRLLPRGMRIVWRTQQ